MPWLLLSARCKHHAAAHARVKHSANDSAQLCARCICEILLAWVGAAAVAGLSSASSACLLAAHQGQAACSSSSSLQRAMAQHVSPTLMVARSLSADILPVLSGCTAQHARVIISKPCGMWQLVQLGATTARCTCCTHQVTHTQDQGMSEWHGITTSLV